MADYAEKRGIRVSKCPFPKVLKYDFPKERMRLRMLKALKPLIKGNFIVSVDFNKANAYYPIENNDKALIEAEMRRVIDDNLQDCIDRPSYDVQDERKL